MSQFDQNHQRVNNQFNIAYGSPGAPATINALLYGTWRLISINSAVNGRGGLSGTQTTTVRPDGTATTSYVSWSVTYRLTDGRLLRFYKNGTLNCTYGVDGESYTQIADPFIGDISVTVDGYRSAEMEERNRFMPVKRYSYMATNTRFVLYDTSGYTEDYSRLG